MKRSFTTFLRVFFRGPTQHERYSVKHIGHYKFEYIEDDHRVIIYGESAGFFPSKIYFSTEELSRWQPPYDNELMSNEKSDEIRQRFMDYFNEIGFGPIIFD